MQSCRVFCFYRPVCSRKLLVCSDGGRNRLLRDLSSTGYWMEWTIQCTQQERCHLYKALSGLSDIWWVKIMWFFGWLVRFFSCRILVGLWVVVVKWCVSGCYKSILLVTWPSLSVSKEKKRRRCRWLMQSYTCPFWCAFVSCLSGLHIAMGQLCNRRTGLHFCLFFPKQHQLMWSTPINIS